MLIKLSDFDYDLPREFIAQKPVEPRDSSRLMVLGGHGIEHRLFHEILDYFEPGDIIVLNDTKVLPARLNCRKDTGGMVELLIMNLLGGDLEGGGSNDTKTQRTRTTGDGYPILECLVKGRVRPGTDLTIDRLPLKAKVVDHIEEGRFRVSFTMRQGTEPDIGIGKMNTLEGFINLIEEHGMLPLPPYIKEQPPDLSRYQTVYSSTRGSIAAPTAGLHFTGQLMDSLKKKDVGFCHITLHISYGTFKPVREESVEDHKMDFEYYRVTEEAAGLINEGRMNKSLTAVGTTCMRTLESIFQKSDHAEACEGITDLFIYPGYKFRAGINNMITNFHFPRSTLLMLVSAFAGRERILNAYEEAKKSCYRFYSFGDAMLILDDSREKGVK